nr:MAG TPA: hypothetical protein [Caudoviricetes sp.]
MSACVTECNLEVTGISRIALIYYAGYTEGALRVK